MARPLKVTRKDALDAAMTVFWSKGYNATTVDDLQLAMGLKRGSFYLHFTDKRTLFFEVLDHYKKSVVEVRREKVRAEASPRKGIETFFSILIHDSLKNKTHSGCLNTNTVTELGLVDTELNEKLCLGIKGWHAFWMDVLENAKAQGEVASSFDTAAGAQLLIALTQGLNVIVKVNPDRKFLQGAVRTGLSFLNH